ncbi:alpha-galactosidase [Vibrio ponticus]|uniref:Alpha-galactosidase n=1 Tax=Vibrio ponticus TaxID=265668 RepID=A0ABX3FMA3_9VIBR|nr:alpha-galactosidase [Vibrio ponticus]OLQ95183.1 alpha-galactosidase [Vibrio ponticus]
MSPLITLQCHAEIAIANHNLLVKQRGDEVSFSYSGLSNDPISSRYTLFSLDGYIEPDALLYGDGFQMGCQTLGTLSNLRSIGNYPDNSSLLRVYSSADPQRFYNHLLICDSLGYTLIGFTSCHRFAGFFEISKRPGGHRITAYIDGEESSPRDWSTYELESVVILKSADFNEVYQQYVEHIHRHHPPRESQSLPPPTGWSSLQSQSEGFDSELLLKNLAIQYQQHSQLDYVLIDQGYQAVLGDWCEGIQPFVEKLREIVEPIKQAGKKPALWLTPFTVAPGSALFIEHPDWLVHDEQGAPLRADKVTWAGLDGKPCYVLDMTHEEVQDHLYELIACLSQELGIELFKLDGMYWGAMKGQRRDDGITSIEAYRIGLGVINQAANGAHLLLSRAPLWPSLGLADGMRVTDDVIRDTRQFEQNALATFLRSWQNGKLWHIDPDRLVLTSLPNQGCERRFYDFHRTVLLASGGVLFSGDPLDDMTPFAVDSIKRLIIRHVDSQQSASFSSMTLQHATLELTPTNDLHCLFNYHQTARDLVLTANHPVDWYDFWTGEKLNSITTQAFEVTLESGLSARAIVTVE